MRSDLDLTDLPAQFLPAIRQLLCRGLDPSVAKTCVRIRENRPLAGGLKADLVNGVALDFDIVVKVSNFDELTLHALLMRTVNRVAPKPRTFPLILDLVNIDNRDGLLLMERLALHDPLHKAVFEAELSASALPQICKKVCEALLRVRRAGHTSRSTLKGITDHRDTSFVDRIREKLKVVLSCDPALKVVLRNAGIVMGQPCCPIEEILARVERFSARTNIAVKPELQHGDPHLGNIMIRHYPFGYGAKLLDPNPFVGFHDPLYDVGKLFHWAEEVGWVTICPDRCVGKLVVQKSKWKLSANSQRASTPERLRRILCKLIDTQVFDELVPTSDSTARQRLPLAIAAAHVGLAAFLTEDSQRDARRFVFAHVLKHLASWDQAMR
jgi:Phosphotransferase enzyme family